VAIESECAAGGPAAAYERLDPASLSTGAEIQAQLPAQRCPVIEGDRAGSHWRPAFQVGRDYYDFIPDPPPGISAVSGETSPWALVMGDVMGKGVPAAC